MTRSSYVEKARHLVLVMGDQLDLRSSALEGVDKEADAVLMLEVKDEASYVPQHKSRLVLFFSAMRHFRDNLVGRGYRVLYSELDDPNNRGSFADEIERWANKARPEKLIVIQPGDFRVEQTIRNTAKRLELSLEVEDDRHFYCAPPEFEAFAADRKSLLLEAFYRQMRRKHDILMEGEGPVGDRWNFDEENRESFGRDGPPSIKAPRSFRQDDITRAVIKLVEREFPDSPGSLEGFDYPVSREQAREALRDFVEHRLPRFGRFQDAMATGRPHLFHSRLSAVMNLHLLDPRAAVDAAIEAFEKGEVPLNAVEGFVRQILGWREYVRGVYWMQMPDYAEMNALGADLPMPAFMWTAETEMNCVSRSVGQLIDHAYAHHIQRLMVLGLFAMLLGVRPYDVHRWHMSMYADAIDWVSLPNVLGMSQYGDGGIVGSKPYSASGNYINRMSDYCRTCRYDPRKATGDNACPFTTLYWDFLSRHRQKFAGNRRMGYQLSNLDRKDNGERQAIRDQADALKSAFTEETYL